jgi:hypothetical protein
VALSPAVKEQLQVNACAWRFVICDPEIDSADFSSLQELLSQRSLILINRELCNVLTEGRVPLPPARAFISIRLPTAINNGDDCAEDPILQ